MQQIFPHYPTNVLIENLRQTRSVNLTVDNILEGLIPLENQRADFDEESPIISRTNAEEQPQPSSSNHNIESNTNSAANVNE